MTFRVSSNPEITFARLLQLQGDLEAARYFMSDESTEITIMDWRTIRELSHEKFKIEDLLRKGFACKENAEQERSWIELCQSHSDVCKRMACLSNSVLNYALGLSRSTLTLAKLSDDVLSAAKQEIERGNRCPHSIIVEIPFKILTYMTLLGVACYRGEIEQVKWFCQRPGFDVNFGYYLWGKNTIMPALFVAASAPIPTETKHEIIRTLIAHGADPLLRDGPNSWWLSQVLRNITLDTLQLLLESVNDIGEASNKLEDGRSKSFLDSFVIDPPGITGGLLARILVYHGVPSQSMESLSNNFFVRCTESDVKQRTCSLANIKLASERRAQVLDVRRVFLRSMPALSDLDASNLCVDYFDPRPFIARQCFERDPDIQALFAMNSSSSHSTQAAAAATAGSHATAAAASAAHAAAAASTSHAAAAASQDPSGG